MHLLLVSLFFLLYICDLIHIQFMQSSHRTDILCLLSQRILLLASHRKDLIKFETFCKIKGRYCQSLFKGGTVLVNIGDFRSPQFQKTVQLQGFFLRHSKKCRRFKLLIQIFLNCIQQEVLRCKRLLCKLLFHACPEGSDPLCH